MKMVTISNISQFDRLYEKNYVKLPISQEIRKIATQKAKEDIRNANVSGLVSRFQTDELYNKITGNIGELVFENWLQENGINYRMDNCTGRADKFDFKINDKTWDIKTANRNMPIETIRKNFGFLINREQARKPYDFYFGILLHGDFAYLMGFIGKEMLDDYGINEDYDIETQALKIPLSDLIEPSKCFNIMDSSRMGAF